MQPNYEFLNFMPTPQEKHVGIAAMRFWGKLIVRFKIVAKKDGTGFFPNPPTYKIVDAQGERYIPAFGLDSNMDNDEMRGILMANVNRILNGVTQPQQQSVFQQPAPAYPPQAAYPPTYQQQQPQPPMQQQMNFQQPPQQPQYGQAPPQQQQYNQNDTVPF